MRELVYITKDNMDKDKGKPTPSDVNTYELNKPKNLTYFFERNSPVEIQYYIRSI